MKTRRFELFDKGPVAAFTVAILLAGMVACGGGSQAPTQTPLPPVKTVTPIVVLPTALANVISVVASEPIPKEPDVDQQFKENITVKTYDDLVNIQVKVDVPDGIEILNPTPDSRQGNSVFWNFPSMANGETKVIPMTLVGRFDTQGTENVSVVGYKPAKATGSVSKVILVGKVLNCALSLESAPRLNQPFTARLELSVVPGTKSISLSQASLTLSKGLRYVGSEKADKNPYIGDLVSDGTGAGLHWENVVVPGIATARLTFIPDFAGQHEIRIAFAWERGTCPLGPTFAVKP